MTEIRSLVPAFGSNNFNEEFQFLPPGNSWMILSVDAYFHIAPNHRRLVLRMLTHNKQDARDFEDILETHPELLYTVHIERGMIIDATKYEFEITKIIF